MKPNQTYSIRIDERIIMTMLVVSIIGLLLTAFRYKTDKPCSAYQFTLYANYFNTGNYIFFKASDTQNAQSWEWDFGDKTPLDKKSGPVTSHIYQQPGEYFITLTLNDRCKQYQKVVINSVQKDSIRYVIPQVIWPQNPVKIGQNVLFTDVTNGANKWEWYIGEGKESKRFITKEVAYTFLKAGVVPVKLFVNGNIDAKMEKLFTVENISVKNNNSAKRNRENVNPNNNLNRINDKPFTDSYLDDRKPTVAAETKPMAPQLTEENFLKMIRGVIKGVLSEKDFEPYLCGNKNVKVSFNGDNISFYECIGRLQKIKRLKSLKASANTDSGTNCILSININYEKKFLGLF